MKAFASEAHAGVTPPGVESVALADNGLFTGPEDGSVLDAPDYEPLRAPHENVTPGLFQTLGIGLIAGRDFTAADKPGSPLVAVINQKMASELFHGANPIGRTSRRPTDKGFDTYRVIGVLADVHYFDPYAPRSRWCFTPSRPIRRTCPSCMYAPTTSMQIDDALARERLVANLAAGFGILAIVLAAIGLYGAGVRLRIDGLLVAYEALRLVGIGCAAGVGLSMAGGKLITARLFGVSTFDLPALLAASAAMRTIAALAVCVPALRASKIDPLTALRCE